MPLSDFAMYRHTQIAHARPYVEGEDLAGIYINPKAAEEGSPRPGDMIVRDPLDHMAPQQLVSEDYFRSHYEIL